MNKEFQRILIGVVFIGIAIAGVAVALKGHGADPGTPAKTLATQAQQAN